MPNAGLGEKAAGVSASATTKWDAVRLALTNFVQAEDMA